MSLQEQEQYVSNLSHSITETIKDYTGSDYEEINTALRHRKTPSAAIAKKIEDLDAAFLGAPPLQHPITVYRGMKGKLDSSLASAYVSTSTDRIVPKDFTGGKCCLFEIQVPAGSKVLPLMRISEVKYEHEVLLHRKGVLVVTYETTRDELAFGHSVSAEPKPTMQIFYVTYIPDKVIAITPTVTQKTIKLVFSAQHWADRISARVNVEELEYFTPEEIVNNIVGEFSESIPDEAKVIAIAKLQSMAS